MEGAHRMNPWQIEWNGLRMGDGTPYVVQTMNLGTGPDVKVTDRARGRRHGTRLGSPYLHGRAITAEIEIGRDMAPEVYERFLEACPVVDELSLESPLTGNVPGIAGSNEFRIDCQLRRRALPTDQDYASGLGHATLEWVAGDPRIYSNLAASYEAGTEEVGENGLAFPLEFPLSFGASVSSGIIPIHNLGNISAPWTARIFGPVSTPHIELVGTGLRLTLNATIAAGEWVDLDSDYGSVLYMSEVSRRNWVGTFSRWFQLPKGTSALRYGAAEGTGSRMTIAYRSAWQ
jgi:hypothetical protein